MRLGLIPSVFVSGLLAAGVLAALPAPAGAADTDVRINELASNGGIPSDWIELVNTGSTAVDLSGYKLKDSQDANVFTIPGGRTIAANGGLATFDLGAAVPLDNGDSARLFKPDGTTLIDSVTFAAHPSTTWSRCPQGTGPLTNTQVGTKGLPNACTTATAWPGSATVTEVDATATFVQDVSGLAYEGTGTAAPGTMWAVQNGGGVLYKLADNAGIWGPTTTWQLNYPGGAGVPDAEGVTLTDAGSAGGVYVASERDGAAGGVSRPSILRYAPNGAGAGALSATNEWNLTADLPGLGPNLGPESVGWVPDSYLVAKGLKKDGGALYNPADFPNHGTGLFFVGIEQDGRIIGYALNHADNTFTRVVTIQKVMSTVTDLVFDPEKQMLWAECDNNCGGRTVLLDVDTNPGPTQGTFVVRSTYERPTGMGGNFNNEGFTVTPQSECVGGTKPVFWADDGDDNGHTLREGTLGCGAPGKPSVTSSTPSAGAVTVAFNPPATAGGSPITSYVAQCVSTDGGVGQAKGGPASPIKVAGVSAGKHYHCRVKATNALGVGPYGGYGATVLVPPAAPSAPSVTGSTPSARAVTVAFNPPASDGGSPVTSYVAQCVSTDGGAGQAKGGPASPIKVVGLTAGKHYHCRVKATNAVGTGPFGGYGATVLV
jgi:hypothetical protein